MVVCSIPRPSRDRSHPSASVKVRRLDRRALKEASDLPLSIACVRCRSALSKGGPYPAYRPARYQLVSDKGSSGTGTRMPPPGTKTRPEGYRMTVTTETPTREELLAERAETAVAITRLETATAGLRRQIEELRDTARLLAKERPS
jgi:hypothetical protein